MIRKKQVKITKLIKKNATRIPTRTKDHDNDELEDEVRELQKILREKQNELFQIQRNSYRRKALPPKKKEDDVFVRPQKITLQNSVYNLKRSLELTSMLTGTEVQSYVSEKHCSVVFHMQHASEHAVSHGIRINMDSGNNTIASSALPLGFNLEAVLEDFDNLMKPECMGAIRKALVAYYDRLEQFERLKKFLNIEAEMFKTLDGSHMEICFFVQSDDEEDHVPITLMLDYRVYNIRPKNYSIKELDLPEGTADEIKAQCVVFKKKPLYKAFKEAFVNGDGLYKLVRQLAPRPVERAPPQRKCFRPKPNGVNDDTFLPEDCSDPGDDDDDDEE